MAKPTQSPTKSNAPSGTKKSPNVAQSPNQAPQSTLQNTIILPKTPQNPTKNPWWQRWFGTSSTTHHQQLEEVKASIMAELSQRGQPTFKSQLFQSSSPHPLLGVRLPNHPPSASKFSGLGWALLAALVLLGLWLGLQSSPSSINTNPIKPIATTQPTTPPINTPTPAAAPACCQGTLLLTDTRRILGADSRLRWTLSLTNPTATALPANTLWQFVVQDAAGQILATTTFVLPQTLPAGGATVHTLVMPLKDTVVGRAVAGLPLMAFNYAVQPLH